MIYHKMTCSIWKKKQPLWINWIIYFIINKVVDFLMVLHLVSNIWMARELWSGKPVAQSPLEVQYKRNKNGTSYKEKSMRMSSAWCKWTDTISNVLGKKGLSAISRLFLKLKTAILIHFFCKFIDFLCNG